MNNTVIHARPLAADLVKRNRVGNGDDVGLFALHVLAGLGWHTAEGVQCAIEQGLAAGGLAAIAGTGNEALVWGDGEAPGNAPRSRRLRYGSSRNGRRG